MDEYFGRRRFLNIAAWVAPLMVVATVSGCGSSDDDNGGGSIANALNCGDLMGMAVPASSIGLPTRGASVTAAVVVPAGGTAPKTFGDYCRVSAEIFPVDQSAPRIMMQIALPTAWNEKAMMFGGGGYNGSIPNVAAATGRTGNQPDRWAWNPFSPATRPRGRQQHAAFAVNDEALRNFALKHEETAIRIFLINKRYGINLSVLFRRRLYGGREALAVNQSGPSDLTA